MMSLYTKKLKSLVEKRQVFVDEYYSSYDEEKNDYTIEEPKEIDSIAKEITDYILHYQYELDVDCIIESLAHIGNSPNILYDDNGHFAICDEGFQTVAYGDEPIDIETSFFVPKEYWAPTIRGALNSYLERFKV